MKLMVIACCVCLRAKWRETDPVRRPGHYARMRLRGWCACVETPDGVTLKEGPMRPGWVG